eukprot:UN12743
MAMWVNLNIDTANIKKHLHRRSIYLQTESEFYFCDSYRSLKPKHFSYLRLGFAGQSVEVMQEGINIIAEYAY